MKAVVLGGNGFIGSHVVDALLVDQWQVTVFDRSPDRYRPALNGVEYVMGDLGNRRLLESVLPRADVVFHMISTTIPESSNESPLFDVKTNLMDSIQLLEACVAARVGKLVFLSSGGTAYGIPQSLPVSEDHPTIPISSYGIVKLAIEKYIHMFHHLHGLPYVILRPANPYGQRQNPLGKQGALTVFLGCIARGLPITIWGDGEVVRDYFHVSDLAKACVLAATSTARSLILNVGSGEGVSLNQMLEIIETVIQKPIRVIRLPDRPFDVPRMVLDVQRIHAELNWCANVSLQQGILDTWDWVRSLRWLDPSLQTS